MHVLQMDNNIIDLCSDEDDGATASSTSFAETSKVIKDAILKRQQSKMKNIGSEVKEKKEKMQRPWME